MKQVEIEDVLYCYIKDTDELNQILEKEKPEFSYDLIEEHREDFSEFEKPGFYSIKYRIVNPCEHGFYVQKKDKSEIDSLIRNLQELLNQAEKY